jgi:hypothetical protein
LGARGWLHDPSRVRESTEFLHKNIVVSRERVGLRDDIHVDVTAQLITLSDLFLVPLEFFAVAFNILDHKIFLGKLIVVREVIDYLHFS